MELTSSGKIGFGGPRVPHRPSCLAYKTNRKTTSAASAISPIAQGVPLVRMPHTDPPLKILAAYTQKLMTLTTREIAFTIAVTSVTFFSVMAATLPCAMNQIPAWRPNANTFQEIYSIE